MTYRRDAYGQLEPRGYVEVDGRGPVGVFEPVSRNGVLLRIPADPFFTELIALGQDLTGLGPYARSVWLRMCEEQLLKHYPDSSAADRALTARTFAPFLLEQPAQR